MDLRTRTEMIDNYSEYRKFFNHYPDFKTNKIITPTFWKYSFPEEHKGAFNSDWSYYQAVQKARKYRTDKLDRVYRLANDFMINDAMDRVSAKQVLKAVDDALNNGTSIDFIEKISKHVQHIKKMERAEKKKRFISICA